MPSEFPALIVLQADTPLGASEAAPANSESHENPGTTP